MLATGVAGAAGASAPADSFGPGPGGAIAPAGNFGTGPGGASAPADNFGPGPGGAMAPGFFFGPGPGFAEAMPGPAPGPGRPWVKYFSYSVILVSLWQKEGNYFFWE